ncbi:MAG: DNA-3-methyladenine glycosylase family protein [Gammaproteobacteria bacterium]
MPPDLTHAHQHLARSDRHMAALIERFGPCQLGRRKRDPFHVLATSIIGQQLSSKAADTIQKRVEAAAGCTSGTLRPEHLLGLEPDALRACGLSNAKSRWLRAISQDAQDGTLDFRKLRRMDDETAIRTLDALPGVGRWTAEMFLIFALNRLDIFSMGDVGLRNALQRLYNKGKTLDDAPTLALTARWAPYRSVASWYLWRLTDGDVQTWV